MVVALISVSGAVLADTTADPVADAGSNQTVNLDPTTDSVTVNFSGSGSYDPDGGNIESYTWVFFGGSPLGGSGVSASTTYTSTGTYLAILGVTDDEGATDSDYCIVYVNPAPNQPPTAGITGGNKTVNKRTSVSFSGSGSTDPDGDDLTYSWSFGDGGTGTGVSSSHTYTASGTYTVSLTVSDGEASDSDSITVTVNNRPPTANISGGNKTINKRTSVSFSGSGSTDPDGDDLTYAWSFGDGTNGTGVSPSHSYSTSGTKTVSLTVSDGEASSSNAASHQGHRQ